MRTKLTPWFPRGTYPKRKGFYIASIARSAFYRYWDGRYWSLGGHTLEAAMGVKHLRWPKGVNLEWRGLASPPSAAAQRGIRMPGVNHG